MAKLPTNGTRYLLLRVQFILLVIYAISIPLTPLNTSSISPFVSVCIASLSYPILLLLQLYRGGGVVTWGCMTHSTID